MKEKGLPESIKALLKNQYEETAQGEFIFFLQKYALERLLYKVSISPYRKSFILKGAMLFRLWSEAPYRSTQDVDFMGSVDNEPAQLEKIFKEICHVPDPGTGLEFDSESVWCEQIQIENEYNGLRVHLTAHLGKSPLNLKVDIGFGGTVVPAPEECTYPTLLDHPAPVLLVYQKVTSIAEKCEAIVAIGLNNTRVKDFFDINALAENYEFKGSALSKTLQAGFYDRNTAFPTEVPAALTDEYYQDEEMLKIWMNFKNKKAPKALAFETTVNNVKMFLWPVLESCSQGKEFKKNWQPGDPGCWV